jgi:hypothetical protein
VSVTSFRRPLRFASLLALAAACTVGPAAFAQASYTPMPLDSGFGPLELTQPSIPVPQIIDKFTAKESEFRAALANYTYERSVRVDTVDDDTSKVDGEYYQVTDISADPNGKLYEHVVYAPQNTLERVMMSPSDFADIEHRLPFVLTREEAGEYELTYIGKQSIDQVDTYVFDVKPKVIEKNQRYFQGRIWVDQRDFQIVVTDGKNVPDDLRKNHEDLSTPFITYRQQIDGKYWFPVYTKGDGVLHFAAGNGYLTQDVHMREVIKYTKYKRFGSTVRILSADGQEIGKDDSGSKGSQQPGSPSSSTPQQGSGKPQ